MRLCVLQHVPFEDAANVGVWAAERGWCVESVHVYRGDPLPAHSRYDLLAIMGGPMNIYEHDRHPWLVEEKRFIGRAIEAGKTIVGVCLGAQLLSDVLGGRVTRNAHREIGWFDVTLTEAGRASGLFEGAGEAFTAFHWHGDRFSIPPGAAHLATSAACDNQAFLWDGRVLGLQFHLDYSAASIEAMLHHCGDELDGSAFVQSADTIRARLVEAAHIQRRLNGLLDRLMASRAVGK